MKIDIYEDGYDGCGHYVGKRVLHRGNRVKIWGKWRYVRLDAGIWLLEGI